MSSRHLPGPGYQFMPDHRGGRWSGGRATWCSPSFPVHKGEEREPHDPDLSPAGVLKTRGESEKVLPREGCQRQPLGI